MHGNIEYFLGYKRIQFISVQIVVVLLSAFPSKGHNSTAVSEILRIDFLSNMHPSSLTTNWMNAVSEEVIRDYMCEYPCICRAGVCGGWVMCTVLVGA